MGVKYFAASHVWILPHHSLTPAGGWVENAVAPRFECPVPCVSKICSHAVFGTTTSIISKRQLRSYAHCQCLEIIVKDTSRAFEFILPKKARAGVLGQSHKHRLEHRTMDQAVPTFLATTTPRCAHFQRFQIKVKSSKKHWDWKPWASTYARGRMLSMASEIIQTSRHSRCWIFLHQKYRKNTYFTVKYRKIDFWFQKSKILTSLMTAYLLSYYILFWFLLSTTVSMEKTWSMSTLWQNDKSNCLNIILYRFFNLCPSKFISSEKLCPKSLHMGPFAWGVIQKYCFKVVRLLPGRRQRVQIRFLIPKRTSEPAITSHNQRFNP